MALVLLPPYPLTSRKVLHRLLYSPRLLTTATLPTTPPAAPGGVCRHRGGPAAWPRHQDLPQGGAAALVDTLLDALIEAQPSRPTHPAPWAVTALAYAYSSRPLTNPSPHYRRPPPRRSRLSCTARCTTRCTCHSSTTGGGDAGGSAAARHDSSAREREWRTERRGPSPVDLVASECHLAGAARAPSLPN